jgi:ADP-L-glycero-D-manno-heptose 6-epimerase
MRPPQQGHEKTIVGLACPSGRAAARSSARLVCPHRPDYADGEQCRDFIYVKDCAAVMLWLPQSAMDSGIYNVGSGQARNFRQLRRSSDNRICRDAARHPTKLSVFH